MNNTAFMSCMLRNSIRSLATVLLAMGLIVNFDLFSSEHIAEGTIVMLAGTDSLIYLFLFVFSHSILADEDDLAGVAGWWILFNGNKVSFGDFLSIHLEPYCNLSI